MTLASNALTYWQTIALEQFICRNESGKQQLKVLNFYCAAQQAKNHTTIPYPDKGSTKSKLHHVWQRNFTTI